MSAVEGTDAYVIGTDEAGYGPNLGPLLVSATVWRIDGDRRPGGKDDPFKGLVRRACDEPDERPLIDDSKAIYGRWGLAALEQATLATLGPSNDAFPTSLRAFWRSLVHRGDACAWEELFWLRDFPDGLPIAPAIEATEEGKRPAKSGSPTRRKRRTPTPPSASFLFARAAAYFPESFNRGVDAHGNKASLLTRATLELAGSILESLPPDATVYWSADRHGGRKSYRDALQAAFPDSLVMTVDESPAVSRYRWIRDGGPVECEFRVEGDRYVPTALASMTAKYLRELCMAAWNAHWLAHRPQLRPTAGYPGDARRFFAEIRDLLDAAQVCETTVWRRC